MQAAQRDEEGRAEWMAERTPEMDELCLPWTVVINPFGPTPGESENIFIQDADGSMVASITKHPVWRQMEFRRRPTAQVIAAAPDLEEACIALIAASHEIPPGPSDLRTALDLAIRATDHLMGPLAEGRADA
jgi:hypothetical protein